MLPAGAAHTLFAQRTYLPSLICQHKAGQSQYTKKLARISRKAPICVDFLKTSGIMVEQGRHHILRSFEQYES